MTQVDVPEQVQEAEDPGETGTPGGEGEPGPGPGEVPPGGGGTGGVPIDDPCDPMLEPPTLGENPLDLGDEPINWYLDIEEGDGTQYSIPLSSLRKDMILDIRTLESMINSDIGAFFDADPSITNSRYEISATKQPNPNGNTDTELVVIWGIREISLNNHSGAYPPAPPSGGPADPHPYAFKINFITGPHGTNAFDFQQLAQALNVDEPTPDLYTTAVIKNMSSIQIGDMPFSIGNTITVTDHPPIPPNVDIYPLRNINNKILFLISGEIGNIDAIPIQIEPSDIEKFREIYISQGMPGAPPNVTMEEIDELVTMNPIRFKNDDPTYIYQVFRTTRPPNSYADFEGSLIAEPIEFISGDPEHPAVLAAYLDAITPNRKYYYCFRAIDAHGNVSNPTTVYQIEMVDNNGQIYPVIETYNFVVEDAILLSKSGRRFIFIEPSYKQTYLNMVSEGPTANTALPTQLATGVSPGDNILGAHGVDQIWEKIFKLRVTSKKTGKKLDLNIIFKNRGLDNP